MKVALSEAETSLELYDLLDEFMKMLRKGQGIPVSEFAKRYPDQADEIVAHLPALLMAEGLKPRVSTAPNVSANATASKPPELLAGYRVLKEVGKGGMGVVYEAEHPKLSRKLAVKILLGHKGRPSISERFRREAEAASRLDHPNIVPVFDFGEQSGVQYLVMPLIEGPSLDRLFETYRLEESHPKATLSTAGTKAKLGQTQQTHVEPNTKTPFADIIGANANFKQLAKLAADVASALTHAHENNTIHRDIKPGNLILDNDGKIWITDFGLAKVRDDGSDLSRTGDVIGTPRFMAPEQMRGLCDERSDVYSLGVTLYEMASGTRAWDTLTSGQLLKARATAELPELAEHAPHVPKPLAEVIMKACSFRPEDRYQSAKEMQIVLNRFAHGQKTGDRRRRSRGDGSAFHRKRTVAGLLVLIPTVTLLTMYFFKAGPWADNVPSQEALISLVQDETQREKVVEQLPDIIEAALTSKDKNVREQATDLTLKVFEQALQKSGVDESDQKQALKRVKAATDAFRKDGFQYSSFDHPLSNAVRNIDLAEQISTLKINAITMATCKFRVAGLGELIKANLISQQEIDSLLALLPLEAQIGSSNQKLQEAGLIKFLHIADRVYSRVAAKSAPGSRPAHADGLQQILNTQITSAEREAGNGKQLNIPKDLKIPDDLKRKILEAAAAKQRANAGK